MRSSVILSLIPFLVHSSLADASRPESRPRCSFADQGGGTEWKDVVSIDARLKFAVPRASAYESDPDAIHSVEIWRAEDLEIRVVTGYWSNDPGPDDQAKGARCAFQIDGVIAVVTQQVDDSSVTFQVFVPGENRGMDAAVTISDRGSQARERVERVASSISSTRSHR